MNPKLRFHTADAKSFCNWQTVRLTDLFDIVNDKKQVVRDVLTIKQGFGTVLRSESGIDISASQASIDNYLPVQKNDFIIHLRSFQGGFEIANSDGIVSAAYTMLRSKQPVDHYFYKIYFRSQKFIERQLKVAVEGIRDGKTVNIKHLKDVQIPLPSIEEQTRVGSFFELLDKKISLTERKVNSLKSLLKGVQQKAFIERKQETKSTSNPYSCTLYTLGEISESFYSGQTPKSAINDFYCGNIPWATSLDLNRSTVLSTIKTISKEGLDSCNLKILPKGSFVISTCGVEAENVAGNCGLLGIDSAISQSLMCIKPKPELVSTEFLFYWYRHFGKSICKHYAHGTKQLHLNFDLMSNLEIVLPSLEEQSKIVDILSKLDEKISLAEQRVLAYKKIKQNLLQQMFV